jgi:hypothetical protein
VPGKQDKVQYNNNICGLVRKAAYYNTNTRYYYNKAADSFVFNVYCLTRRPFRLNYF